MRLSLTPFLPLLFATGFACSQPACSSATPQPQTTVALVTVGCIIVTVTSDVIAGDPWTQCVADATKDCNTDEPTVTAVWADHVAGEVKEGFVPRMPVPGTVTSDGGSALQ
jgi:hypothetical protein